MTIDRDEPTDDPAIRDSATGNRGAVTAVDHGTFAAEVGPVALSRRLLGAVRADEPIAELRYAISALDRSALADAEHGLLRRSRLRRGMGYSPDPVSGQFGRRSRVARRDPRIHFALNFGGRASCPPIAVYAPESIGRELDVAAESYLAGAVEFDPNGDAVRVPRLCLWHQSDFGGADGIRALLRRYDLLPEGATSRVTHDSYDWSLDMGNYREPSA